MKLEDFLIEKRSICKGQNARKSIVIADQQSEHPPRSPAPAQIPRPNLDNAKNKKNVKCKKENNIMKSLDHVAVLIISKICYK